MATKAELGKAYEAGQAAQRDHLTSDVCPFEDGSEFAEAWFDGYNADLAEKWLPAGGNDHHERVTN